MVHFFQKYLCRIKVVNMKTHDILTEDDIKNESFSHLLKVCNFRFLSLFALHLLITIKSFSF